MIVIFGSADSRWTYRLADDHAQNNTLRISAAIQSMKIIGGPFPTYQHSLAELTCQENRGHRPPWRSALTGPPIALKL
jgi:hypothetical protein